MLIDEPSALEQDAILSLVSGPSQPLRIEKGCYLIGHFGSSHFLQEYKEYSDDLSVDPFGVCDSLQQLKAACPELEGSQREFVVTLTEVRKDEQPDEGGWRWKKWGPYIGEHEITTEYLRDEEHIDRVFCYHIYERVQESLPDLPYYYKFEEPDGWSIYGKVESKAVVMITIKRWDSGRDCVIARREMSTPHWSKCFNKEHKSSEEEFERARKALLLAGNNW